jgi:hypothetical protein
MAALTASANPRKFVLVGQDAGADGDAEQSDAQRQGLDGDAGEIQHLHEAQNVAGREQRPARGREQDGADAAKDRHELLNLRIGGNEAVDEIR